MENLIVLGTRTKLSASSIIMLEASINYTYVYFADGETKILSCHLKKIEGRLNEFSSFVRPNRNVIVNLDFLTQYQDGFLILNQKKVAVSRRRMKEIIDKVRPYQTLF